MLAVVGAGTCLLLSGLRVQDMLNSSYIYETDWFSSEETDILRRISSDWVYERARYVEKSLGYVGHNH